MKTDWRWSSTVLAKSGIQRFACAPIGDQLLALEAALQLFFARVNTLGSAKHFTSFMGELDGSPVSSAPTQQIRAARIGYIVEQTARFMPFRCVCLQQVLAVRRMLLRRHIPSTVYLGVLPDGFSDHSSMHDREDGTLTGAIAHAWVKSGDHVVNGGTGDLDQYVVVGVFS